MTNELEKIEMLREPMAIGQVFVESGMFPDIKTQAQAVVKILAGRELGLTPFESMNGIYIVNNKLSIMANTLASLVKKKKKYDYKVTKLDETECSIEFYEVEKSQLLGTSVFTIKDAAKAGIINNTNWKNYPRNMLFARALSNGVRWYCPDASCGYTVEEMQDVSPQINTQTKTISLKDEEVADAQTSV